MTAIEIREPGPPQVLRAVQRPVPQLQPGEVLVRVVAAGVNRPDVLQRKGNYPPPPGASDVPGLEVAGEVVAASPGVREPAVGAKVCALVAGGGYAQYVNVPAVQCLPVPGRLSLEEAAALPGDLLHRVDERVRARAPASRGDAARARRLERHRHDRHHARQGLRGARDRDRRHRRTSAAPAASSAPMSPSTTTRPTSSRRRCAPPTARGPTSSSTWSVAITWRATPPPPRSMAASR